MKAFATFMLAIWAIAGLAACESTSQYDGVSRFAGQASPYYRPGSPPREAEAGEPAGDSGNI